MRGRNHRHETHHLRRSWSRYRYHPGHSISPSRRRRSGFQLQAITLRDVTFLFDLAVKNPYPVSLPFDGMTLVFKVEGSTVFTAASKGGFTVSANGEQSDTFTVTLAYDAIMALIKNYVSKDWLTTVIDGTLVIPLPKIPGLPKDVTFSYSLSKKIPAIKPKLALLDFKVSPPTAQQVAEAVTKAVKVSPGKALGVFKDVIAGRSRRRRR